MDHGSTYVWLYDCSDEELVSDSELQEGMWLSDSDEDERPSKPPPAAVAQSQVLQAPVDLEGSRTKYDQFTPDSDEETDDDDDDDEDDDEEEEEGRVVPKQIPKYVDVDFLNTSNTGHAHPDPTPPSSKQKAVEYAEVQAFPPPPPPPPLAGASGGASGERVKEKKKKIKKPVIRVEEPTRRYTTPATGPPPPPPAAPPRGIIKNRLVPGVRKIKRQRVKWDRNDSNESGRVHRARRADTNILVVKFNTLTGPSHVHTGDAVLCGNDSCTAILSHLSRVTDHKDPQKDEKVWVCEFCGTSNEIDIVPEEMPTKEDTTYMTAAAPVVGGGAVGGALVEDSIFVFCIDVSGSMCVTTEVPGKFQLKGHERVRGPTSLNEQGEDQYMPRQRRDVTYVSRLQSVQAAVDHQLSTLSRVSPSQRVAIITFSDEVTAIGDGRNEVVTLAGDKLWSSDAVVKAGGEVPLPSAVKDTRATLSKKVFDLEEGGQTALGPAILLSVTMASRVPGSKVIICTDGLANKGVGSLDDLRTDEAQAEAQTFYEDLGALALQKGVTVSLVTIKGTDCKTLELGQVADSTGGQVNIVDPLTITKEFSSILANPIIATNVTTKIILHSELYFRREDAHESVLTIPVGNVTADTELSYEYGVRNKKKLKKKSPVPISSGAPAGGASATASDEEVPQLVIDGTPHLPFQLQIQYTSQDGSRCMRVISQAKPTTKQRDVAEKDIDMAVVGTHVAHQTAQMAMEGEYTHARMNALVSQRLMQRSSHCSPAQRQTYSTLMGDLIPLENQLRDKQVSERTTFGRQHSDDEDEERCMYDRSSDLMGTALARERPSKTGALGRVFKSAPKKKKAISRRKEVSDELATYMYKMKSTSSPVYQSQRPDDSDSDK